MMKCRNHDVAVNIESWNLRNTALKHINLLLPHLYQASLRVADTGDSRSQIASQERDIVGGLCPGAAQDM